MEISYGAALQEIDSLLKKFRSDMNEQKRQEFLYSFFPFMFGIYPYTVVSDKQREAMDQAKVNYTYSSLYTFIYNATRKMLEN